MREGGILRKLSHLSIGGAIEIARHPSLLPARFPPISGSSISDIVHFFLPAVSVGEADVLRKEFLEDHVFFESVNKRFVEKRGRRVSFSGWPELLYVLVRSAHPARIVETGIFDGHSSAVILRALEKNGSGELISIDLPAYAVIESSTSRMRDTVLPPGLDPGWIIPESLRTRHQLILGDSKEELPKVLEEKKSIDMFIHDSLHTFGHQWFEYTVAWPRIVAGGFLLSDDVFWNTAFHRFCRHERVPYRVYAGFGVAKK